MLLWQDYQGPYSKTVGLFASKLERKSVHPPQFKPGVLLCSFTPKRKFILFVQDSTDPLTFLAVPTILFVVAAAAILIPARGATRIDPMIALRYD